MKTFKYKIRGDEVIVTDSIIVAREFGLRHDNLLRTVKRIINIKRDTLTSESISFVEDEYKNS